MVKFKILLGLLLCLLFIVSFGQGDPTDPPSRTLEVSVIDIGTKKPVTANITYETIPYGSKVGVVRNDKFTFYLEEGETYIIYIKAKGYVNVNEEVSYSELASQGFLKKTVELIPEGVEQVIRLERLFFAQGKYTINKDSHEELDKLAIMLKKSPSIRIQLEGHTDFRGNPRQNLKLSQQRVAAVRKYLVGKGIEKRRIKTKAFGGTQPLSKKNNPESHKENRRVEVRILTE